MDIQYSISSLDRFPAVLEALVGKLDEATYRFKPDLQTWSIVEVVCHLRDEEKEDFRLRLQMTFDDPQQPWPPIDPPGAAIERNYQAANPQQALQAFLRERAASLEWLRSLDSPNWEQAYQHPSVGPVPASRLLGSWAAHDLLHLKQITKRLFECTQLAAEHSLDYAGEW